MSDIGEMVEHFTKNYSINTSGPIPAFGPISVNRTTPIYSLHVSVKAGVIVAYSVLLLVSLTSNFGICVVVCIRRPLQTVTNILIVNNELTVSSDTGAIYR
jgi:hypothetical protein